MPDLIIQLIIVMLICGFCYWVWLQLMPLMPIAQPFAGIINVLVVILIGAIVLFYAIIPLLHALGHISLSHLGSLPLSYLLA
jgi:hypothetical protein